jgi:NitT/TauT family transport system permease protein
MMKKLKPIVILGIWLLLWQIASLIIGQELFLVSPVKVALTLGSLLATPEFWQSIFISFSRIMLGFILAFTVGTVLAVLTAKLEWLHDFIAPLLNVIKATPVASFIILALVWINSKNLSVFISFLMVLPVIYTNIRQGIKSIDRNLIEVGEVFALSKKKMLRYLYLPSMVPYIASACTVGIGLCWKSGISAEVIGLPNNTMGMHLYNAKVYLNTPDLFAWTVAIILLSVAMEKILLTGLNLVMKNYNTAK